MLTFFAFGYERNVIKCVAGVERCLFVLTVCVESGGEIVGSRNYVLFKIRDSLSCSLEIGFVFEILVSHGERKGCTRCASA